MSFSDVETAAWSVIYFSDVVGLWALTRVDISDVV